MEWMKLTNERVAELTNVDKGLDGKRGKFGVGASLLPDEPKHEEPQGGGEPKGDAKKVVDEMRSGTYGAGVESQVVEGGGIRARFEREDSGDPDDGARHGNGQGHEVDAAGADYERVLASGREATHIGPAEVAEDPETNADENGNSGEETQKEGTRHERDIGDYREIDENRMTQSRGGTGRTHWTIRAATVREQQGLFSHCRTVAPLRSRL